MSSADDFYFLAARIWTGLAGGGVGAFLTVGSTTSSVGWTASGAGLAYYLLSP